jgi:hypothetical protein
LLTKGQFLMSLRTLTFSALLMASSVVTAAADTVLIMVEEQGCMWCARWNEEIADIYPKTGEGRAAPLQRIDIHDARPEGMTFARGLNYTPTFVLMVDGVEAARLEGYPGEDFFWGLLGQMLQQAKVDITG